MKLRESLMASSTWQLLCQWPNLTDWWCVLMFVLQALERKAPTDVPGSTGSAFTFLNDDTDSTSDHHGWEVSHTFPLQHAWILRW